VHDFAIYTSINFTSAVGDGDGDGNGDGGSGGDECRWRADCLMNIHAKIILFHFRRGSMLK